MIGQEDLPKFRRHKDDRRYYEAPGRFPLNTAYTEVNHISTNFGESNIETIPKILNISEISDRFKKSYLNILGLGLVL